MRVFILRRGTLLVLGVLLAATAASAAMVGSFVSVPLPSGRASLTALSCPSNAMCYAVGERARGHASVSMVERWNGHAWSRVSAPAASGATPLAISCSSTTSCMAVGVRGGSRGSRPFAESWNGRSWRVVNTPSLPSFDNSLSGVSCVSSSFCVAVGSTQTQTASQAALVERWNGGRWSAERVAASPKGFLRSVSCASEGDCWAVGMTALSLRSQAPLIVHVGANGSTVAGSPVSKGILGSVSCTSPQACWAVGNERSPFFIGLQGGSWHTLPATNRFGEMLGISCATSLGCVAVGNGLGAFGGSHMGQMVPWAARWDGTTWTALGTPQENGATFSSVACPDASLCLAVGYGRQRPLAARSQPGGAPPQGGTGPSNGAAPPPQPQGPVQPPPPGG